jgi:hypothetical protein
MAGSQQLHLVSVAAYAMTESTDAIFLLCTATFIEYHRVFGRNAERRRRKVEPRNGTNGCRKLRTYRVLLLQPYRTTAR